jgi:hypothetical protein
VGFVVDKVALGQVFFSQYLGILIHTSIIDAVGESVGIPVTAVSRKWEVSEKVDL